jgi:hypothetical protein
MRPSTIAAPIAQMASRIELVERFAMISANAGCFS